jgi:hypothetical protein
MIYTLLARIRLTGERTGSGTTGRQDISPAAAPECVADCAANQCAANCSSSASDIMLALRLLLRRCRRGARL